MPGAIASFNGQINIAGQRQAAAAIGKYYVFTNPTPDTAVVTGVVTAFSATANGLFTIYNNNASGGPIIQLDYLTLMLRGTAPTATLVQKLQVFMESVQVTPSAGNVAVTPRNLLPNGSPTGAIVNGYSAASMTIPAAVGVRTLVANAQLATNLGITGDTYTYYFGGDPAGGVSFANAARSAAAARLVATTTPVTIPPGYTAIIDWYWAAQATNGANFEFECGYFES
jgi:hypothetical protein